MDWTQVPWSYISGAAIFLLGFQVIIEFAEAVTYEVFVPLGLLLAIPMCAVAEELWSFPVFNSMEIAATILIIMGFFMVIIPENIHTKISKLIKAKHEEHRKRPERPLSRGARSSPQMVR
ncbi:uncharacterized protein LOC106179698 [Lingula anatina]|uniref:Uncharacterized protein LOC106179698 n=1 Tax=Lingula anatina TaxID=7574 RepID=A0A1S3K8V9_LINAN|nr:uncharacterized protein LOC106179698 [Lingula anatina]|eukprot:XP_013418879.1 uncharacterized protein LOC106179698 [Lingula anatina]